MCSRPFSIRPLALASSPAEYANELTRMPPSNSVSLPPVRKQNEQKRCCTLCNENERRTKHEARSTKHTGSKNTPLRGKFLLPAPGYVGPPLSEWNTYVTQEICQSCPWELSGGVDRWCNTMTVLFQKASPFACVTHHL